MLRLPKFSYHRPASGAEAVRIVAAHGGEARYVAGGTDLYPNMKRRVQRPGHVVALSRCQDLRGMRGEARSGVTIGAMTTLSAIEHDPRLRAEYPGFVHAASVVSTPLLRNMGTIGGNLLLDTRCNYYDQSHEWRESIDFCKKCDGSTCWVAPSSPRCWAVQSSDTVPLLCAIDASVTLLGADGERRVPLRALYRDDGIDFVQKRHEELLTALHLPATNGWRASYRKLRRRGSFDFPVLGVGACLSMDGDRVAELDVRIGGAGSWPIPAQKTVEMLRGAVLRFDDAASDELIRAAAQEAYKPTRAMDNTDLDAHWRKKMAPVFVARAIRDCLPGAPPRRDVLG
ncbi:MAG: FAD binding domain-containing protein [Planctomycetes bacterium]|nr:FAD binding domain-containing protein [Planctomycetota bacterium]